MRKYLVLENDQKFVDGTYKPYQRDISGSESAFDLVFVESVDAAKKELAFGRFNGAILDLRLSDTDTAEGNEIAKQIHRDYLMPIAVVTGFEDELEPQIRQLADGGSAFVRIFNKNGMIRLVFEFLFKIEQSGVLQIVGPGGEMNQMLSDIFWKHLGQSMAQLEGQTLDSTGRKRLLRHAVAHMIGVLQSHEPGKWDKYLPGEVYIWPPITQNEMTGDIYAQLDKGNETGRFYLLVTPICDLASKTDQGAMRHFVEILPFAKFNSESRVGNLISKREHRYHVLPPAPVFAGGVADFASVTSIPAEHVGGHLVRKGTVIEPYSRELVARLGAWLSRQGTPEIDKELLLSLIKRQWPGKAESVKN